MLTELTPNYSPNSKGVKCQRGAQTHADKQMETSNCAAPISSYSPAPSPTPGLGRGPPASAHARLRSALPPRPGRDCRVPCRGAELGVPVLSNPGGVLRNSALGSSPPSSTRVPRSAPGPHTPAPRRPCQARPQARARPACPRGRPEGTASRREGGTEGLRTGGRCLPGSGPAKLRRSPRAAVRPRAARGPRRLMLGTRARGTRPPAAAPALRQLRAEQISPQLARGSASERGGGTERARSGRAPERGELAGAG